MTPDERTTVLNAILNHDLNDERRRLGRVVMQPNRWIVCPDSWLRTQEALGGSNESISYNWNRLGTEQKLLIWLEAPDSDYEFVVKSTHVMKGSNL